VPVQVAEHLLSGELDVDRAPERRRLTLAFTNIEDLSTRPTSRANRPR
jgi:hypothetical protein